MIKYLFLIVLILVCHVCCLADTNSTLNSVLVKTNEQWQSGVLHRTIDTYSGGVIEIRESFMIDSNQTIKVSSRKLYKRGKVVFSELKNNALQQHTAVRIYWREKQPLIEEIDENGDGFFEFVLIFNSTGEPVEAFHKTKDGVVTLLQEKEFKNLLERLQLPMLN